MLSIGEFGRHDCTKINLWVEKQGGPMPFTASRDDLSRSTSMSLTLHVFHHLLVQETAVVDTF